MPLPCTGGHEVAGEIAALGPGVNTKLWAEGQRVAVRLLYNCGECYYCRTGRTNMCERAQKKPVREGLLPGPGGLCDYIIVDAASLLKIPDTLTYEEACLTEPLACCVHSVSRANIQLGEDVVIIGGGIMGQYHVMLAKRRGARVILSEVDPARRALAENLGADITLNPMEQDPVEFVKGITDGRGADVVFNTTAIPNAMVGYGSVVAIAFLVSEVKNPNRTVPKSMAISMVLVVLLYLLMIIATMGNITTQLLTGEEALYYSRGTSLDRDFQIRQVSLADVVRDALRHKARTLIGAHVAPELGELDFTVRADPKWLSFVIGQVLVNAA